jgi:hypothetical protein
MIKLFFRNKLKSLLGQIFGLFVLLNPNFAICATGNSSNKILTPKKKSVHTQDSSNHNKKVNLDKLQELLEKCVMPGRNDEKRALMNLAKDKNYADLLLSLLEEVARCPDGENKGKFDLIFYLDEKSLKKDCGSADFHKPEDVVFAIHHPYFNCSDDRMNKYGLAIAKLYEDGYYIGFFYNDKTDDGINKTFYRTAGIIMREDSESEAKLCLHEKTKDPDFGCDFVTAAAKYFEETLKIKKSKP